MSTSCKNINLWVISLWGKSSKWSKKRYVKSDGMDTCTMFIFKLSHPSCLPACGNWVSWQARNNILSVSALVFSSLHHEVAFPPKCVFYNSFSMDREILALLCQDEDWYFPDNHTKVLWAVSSGHYVTSARQLYHYCFASRYGVQLSQRRIRGITDQAAPQQHLPFRSAAARLCARSVGISASARRVWKFLFLPVSPHWVGTIIIAKTIPAECSLWAMAAIWPPDIVRL